jgi:hypothetical protein
MAPLRAAGRYRASFGRPGWQSCDRDPANMSANQSANQAHIDVVIGSE